MKLAVLALGAALLAGCTPEPSPPPPAADRSRALERAVQAPLDKARAVEQQVQAAKEKQDEEMRAQEE